MAMKSRINLTLLFLCVLTFLATSCESKKDRFRPDFSTPETALRTAKYASQHKLGEVFLESLSQDIKMKYGLSREAQLKVIKEGFKKKDIFQNTIIEVILVDRVKGSPELVDVFFNQMEKGKVFLKNGRIRMIREEGLWRIALDESGVAKTPEELAKLQEQNNYFKNNDFILDEQKNFIKVVPKKQTEKNGGQISS